MKYTVLSLFICAFIFSCKKKETSEEQNRVMISKITIVNFPENNFETDGTDPDVFIYFGKLSSGVGENLFYTSVEENLAKSSLPYSFTINPNINLMHNDTLLMDLYEKDSTSPSQVSQDIIDRFTYVINKTDHPKEIEVWGIQNSFNCKVRLTLSWY